MFFSLSLSFSFWLFFEKSFFFHRLCVVLLFSFYVCLVFLGFSTVIIVLCSKFLFLCFSWKKTAPPNGGGERDHTKRGGGERPAPATSSSREGGTSAYKERAGESTSTQKREKGQQHRALLGGGVFLL